MRHTRWALFAIIFLGFLLRLFILSQRGSFWFDEAFSAHFASMNLREMWSFLKFENNPPLYFAVLRFWMKWFGNSELAVRSLSMIFGLTSIPMVYLVGKTLTPTLSQKERGIAGLFAAFLMAISSFPVFYATETRMYSLYLFLTLTSVWLFLNMSRQGLRRSGGLASVYRFVALFIVLLVLVWTHITAWFIVLAMLAYIFWQSRFSFKQFYILHFTFLISVALVALSFLPWAWNFARLKIVAPVSQGYFFYIPPSRNYFIDILETFLVFGQQNAFVITILSVVMVILLWFAVRGTNVFSPCPRGRLSGGGSEPPLNPLLEKEGKALRFLLCWLFVPLLTGFAFQNAIPRYFIAVAPALYLLMGIGFARYREAEPPKLRRLGLLFPILIFTLTITDYASLSKVAHHRWDGLAQWVTTMQNVKCKIKNNCLILVNPHSEILPFERYYRGNLPVVGFYPREDNDSRDLRIVKTNWISLNTKENVRALADVTQDFNRVFLITGEIDQTIGRNLVPLWFWENGWRKIAGGEFGKISVIILERNSL